MRIYLEQKKQIWVNSWPRDLLERLIQAIGWNSLDSGNQKWELLQDGSKTSDN